MKTISHMEFRRRVFNHALLECFSRILENCCEFDQTDTHDRHLAGIAKKMSDAFYTDKLSLDKCTINQTKQKLSESVTFIKDCMKLLVRRIWIFQKIRRLSCLRKMKLFWTRLAITNFAARNIADFI